MADGKVRAGTASWTDPTLVKESDWYPRKSMSARDRLAYYSSIFTMVEVDATYYHPPAEQTAQLWAERTPDGFRFDVKAYALLSGHPARRDSLWEEVADALPAEHEDKRNVYLSHLPDDAQARAYELFTQALAPLDAAGKLGAVFVQLPPWFVNTRDNRAWLDTLPGRMPGLRLAVEFRHRTWLAERSAPKTLDQLERLGISYVCVDEPQGFDSSVPPVIAATNGDLAVLRFHGQNAENWERKGITAAERFRYLYDEEELQTWVPKVRELAGQARETHVVFNNCYRDYGVTNARQLAALLGDGLQPDAPAQS